MSQANDLEQTPDIVEKPDDGQIANPDDGGIVDDLIDDGNELDNGGGQDMDGVIDDDNLLDDDGYGDIAAESDPKGLQAAVDNVQQTLGAPGNGSTANNGEQGDGQQTLGSFNANSMKNFFASETAYNSQNELDDDSQYSDNDKDALGFGQQELAAIIKKYQNELADHERIEIELGEQIQEYNDRVFTLENLNNSKDNEITKLEEKLEKALENSAEYRVLQTNYQNLQEQYNELSHKYEAIKAKDYPSKIRQLENQNLKNEQIISSLRNENGKLQKNYDAVNLKLAETVEQKNQNAGQLQAYKNENESLKSRRDELNNQISTLTATFNDLKKKYSMLAQYTKQQALIINQLSKLVPNIEKLTETFAGIQLNAQDIDSIADLNGTSNDGDSKLVNHLGRLSNASDILQNSNFADRLQKEAEIEDEIERYRDQFDEMKQEMSQKDSEIAMLQNKMENLTKNEQLLSNYNSLREQYSLMNKQVSSLHESILNLTKQVSDRDKLIKAMVNDKYETVSVLSKQLDFLRNLIKKHNLSINLTPDSTESQGFLGKLGLGAWTSWMTAGGTATGDDIVTATGTEDDDIAGQ